MFDRGRAGAVAQAASCVTATRAAAKEARRAAALEVWEATVVLDDTRAQAELAVVRSEAARAALDAELARYQAGETTLQAVAQLRARVVDAETRRAVLAVTEAYPHVLLRIVAGDE